MKGENYVREGFEHKVDALHNKELKHRRVVPILETCAGATHGVGVVDKDHSNFEKDILEFLGLDDAWDKCEGPRQDEVFLGVRPCINGDGEGTVSPSLPPAKCERLRQTALKLTTEGWDRWLKISEGAKSDFRFVADSLALYNGQQVVLSKRVVKPSHFSVDAPTGMGMGSFLNGNYFAVSWLELMAMPQEVFYPFRDRASSQINYLELFSVFWALALWGEGLRGLTVVLIMDNTPTKGMLEKWKYSDDLKLFAEDFSRLDKRFGPFSVDASCDALGANKQALVCWTVRQDSTTMERLAIPKLVSDSMAVAVDARC
ncbi:hypothetical protein CYMTET_19414 [Cymbomonas tetramitiformis]|uniref:Uncharacterized protein n=1 Tax=Cymbomonas tetramitiformis TaxID=36881 RepID=A0AAE0G6M3_9CHLO|nr:hypothetical protein CYMTET_19414 [Cymbomonas tetramitiformis]